IEVADSVVGFSFSPDGRRIAVQLFGQQYKPLLSVRQVAVFDAGTGERISTIETETLASTTGSVPRSRMIWPTSSLYGSRVAFAGPGGCRIHLVDVMTGIRCQGL